MFTGIIEKQARVVALTDLEGGQKLWLELDFAGDGCREGDSVSVNGCCLTVESREGPTVTCFHATRETLSCTNLGRLAPGMSVNIERALPVSGRFDGHIVSGHVEGLARLVEVVVEPTQTLMSLAIPAPLGRYVLYKGSIALDGVSLTVAAFKDNVVTVSLIPKTLELTNLRHRVVGDALNVETDMIGKWIERLLSPYEADRLPGAGA